MSQPFRDEISIVIGGEAGQGIQTIESLLVAVLKNEGYHVCATKEYMSRIRGGSNSTEIRITPRKRFAYVKRIDVLFALDEGVLHHMRSRIAHETLIIADTKRFKKKYEWTIIDAPLGKMSQEIGNPVFTNTVAVGMILGLLKLKIEGLHQILEKTFSRKGTDIVRKNIQAGESGYAWGKHLAFFEGLEVSIPKRASVENDLLMSGGDALGAGVLAGGCNFIGSYPMSPGTTLLTFLARHGERFGIAVEQVEDEIAAINMALGAWYAGARAIVTTSGGGFALMEEGVSLSGMLETPVVIHIAQRPGPATGLPTRTEQADLNLALYSGHGEFPRAIFAPGSLEELFEAGKEAFRIADTYQSPVFILTDQYLLDMVATIDPFSLRYHPVTNEIVRTEEKYVRYAMAENGLSPRGIPGYGEGLVVVDSDEHTEEGHITEEYDVRAAMMSKRMKKMEGMRRDALKPSVHGGKKAKTVVVGWGSTKGVIQEALEKSDRADTAHIHFKQVYPLPNHLESFFEGAEKIVVIENNFTGQFANLLKSQGIGVTDTVLKYNGEPFCVEELTEKIKNL